MLAVTCLHGVLQGLVCMNRCALGVARESKVFGTESSRDSQLLAHLCRLQYCQVLQSVAEICRSFAFADCDMVRGCGVSSPRVVQIYSPFLCLVIAL